MPQSLKSALLTGGSSTAKDRKLVTWGCRGKNTHDDVSHVQLARRAADLLRMEYCGRLEDFAGNGRPYCIPRDTLCGEECRQHLGEVTELDFLGGWVSHPDLATKAVVHPLAPGEIPPSGWSNAFVSGVKNLTLAGFTALTLAGAMRAGKILLGKGDVRVKAVNASGGTQQHVVATLDELSEIVDRFGGDEGLRDRLVLEENLSDVCTYSVGQIRLGENLAAYLGEQDLTSDNSGEKVYGGSRLSIFRGQFPDLTRTSSAGEAEICDLALRFDRLASQHLGLVASRRNYDIVAGTDRQGRQRRAVLEQSWRVGGATGAELAALEAFERDPGLSHVRAATVERYGGGTVPPEDAVVYFNGTDPVVGPVMKYTIVQEYH